TAIAKDRDPQRPELAVGLGNVHASHRAGSRFGFGRQLTGPSGLCLWGGKDDPIDAGGVLASIFLRDAAHADQSIGVRAEQELLERADLFEVAVLGSPKQTLPKVADKPVGLGPVDRVPIGLLHGYVCRR